MYNFIHHNNRKKGSWQQLPLGLPSKSEIKSSINLCLLQSTHLGEC